MSCDKEKLSIPLEAHHKAQSSEVFPSFPMLLRGWKVWGRLLFWWRTLASHLTCVCCCMQSPGRTSLNVSKLLWVVSAISCWPSSQLSLVSGGTPCLPSIKLCLGKVSLPTMQFMMWMYSAVCYITCMGTSTNQLWQLPLPRLLFRSKTNVMSVVPHSPPLSTWRMTKALSSSLLKWCWAQTSHELPSARLLLGRFRFWKKQTAIRPICTASLLCCAILLFFWLHHRLWCNIDSSWIIIIIIITIIIVITTKTWSMRFEQIYQKATTFTYTGIYYHIHLRPKRYTAAYNTTQFGWHDWPTHNELQTQEWTTYRPLSSFQQAMPLLATTPVFRVFISHQLGLRDYNFYYYNYYTKHFLTLTPAGSESDLNATMNGA